MLWLDSLCPNESTWNGFSWLPTRQTDSVAVAKHNEKPANRYNLEPLFKHSIMILEHSCVLWSRSRSLSQLQSMEFHFDSAIFFFSLFNTLSILCRWMIPFRKGKDSENLFWRKYFHKNRFLYKIYAYNMHTCSWLENVDMMKLWQMKV